MPETLTKIWTRQNGGPGKRDGSTYETAFTFDEMINWMNSEFNQPLTEGVDIYLVGESDIDPWTFSEDPPLITVKGNAYAHISFSGRNSNGDFAEVTFLGSGRQYIFGSESEVEYFSFRGIFANFVDEWTFQTIDRGAVFWFPNHVRHCHFYNCNAEFCNHLMTLGVSEGAPLMASTIRCRGKGMTGHIFNFGVHGSVTGIECYAAFSNGVSHCYSGGGTYMRCIANFSTFNGFHRIKDAIALTTNNCANGIEIGEDVLSFVIDSVCVESQSAAILLSGTDSFVLARHFANFNDENRIGGAVTSYDIHPTTLGGFPYIDVSGENLGLNDDSGAGLRDIGFSLPGHVAVSYHDVGAVESLCVEVPAGDGPFTGTVLDRSVA